MTTRIVAHLAFACAGQRCLAASTAVTVGEARGFFLFFRLEGELFR